MDVATTPSRNGAAKQLALELLTYLSPCPLPVETLALDLGVPAHKIETLAGRLGRAGVNVRVILEDHAGLCARVTYASWARAQQLAEDYWAERGYDR